MKENIPESPGKDFYKRKCHELIFQKQKYCSDIIDYKSQVSWCISQIEKLKALSKVNPRNSLRNEALLRISIPILMAKI